jgi:hypothetical protein
VVRKFIVFALGVALVCERHGTGCEGRYRERNVLAFFSPELAFQK